MSDLTKELASFIATASVPAEVCDKAKKPFVDTLGVMLSGANSEVAAPLRAYLKKHHPRGDAPVLGTELTAPAEIAAMVNGTFGHALDFDDGIELAPVHPSSVVIAALLAQARGMSGTALLEAYVIGVEVTTRLAVAIGIEHYHHGWHGTGTLGVFGAVAALAHARRAESTLVRTAFGLAASMASGVQRNFGTMTKPLHTGWAARSAVTALELAFAGFSSATDALEAPNGFFAVYGNEGSDPDRVMREIGHPYVVAEPGVSLKRYPCCYASHRPIEGVLALRREMGLDRNNVASVHCTLAPGSMRALIYPRPTTGLEGKFSLEYALAAGVLDPRYTLWTFSDEAVRRPEAQALLKRVTAVEDARCAVGDPYATTRGPSRRGFVEVQVEARDGRRAVRRIDTVPGSAEQELTWDEIRIKFCDCADSAGLDNRAATTAFERLTNLERCADISSSVLRLLRRKLNRSSQTSRRRKGK